NIIPYMIIPGRVQLYPIDTTGSFSVDVSVPLPELTLLDDPVYTIRYGISVYYELEEDDFNPTKSFMSEPEKIIQSAVTQLASDAFTELMSDYVTEGYFPDRIQEDWTGLKSTFLTRVRKGGEQYGVRITQISEETVPRIPDDDMYQYGISLRDDLLELRRRHAIEVETIQHSLDVKKIQTEQYYGELQKISDLISQNPDLLKYMYIEKLGENVQVILPQGMSGYPFGLDRRAEVENTAQEQSSDEDVDNLE
ncbi:MAG: hypothetical protein ACOCWH_06890, partial [Spirochaetota bacterium]